MTKQKFNVLVTRTDEYEIEIDTDVWTPEAIKAWSEVFSPAESAKDMAGIVAQRVADRNSASQFFEGFGHLNIAMEINGKMEQVNVGCDDKVLPSLNVVIVEECNFQYETEEIKSDGSA